MRIGHIGRSPLIAALVASGLTLTNTPGLKLTSVVKEVKKNPRKRLEIARGAGSISAKADILQLVRLGRRSDAADMAEDHRRQCGEQLFPRPTLEAWRA